mgnify:CR=1 FL=1
MTTATWRKFSGEIPRLPADRLPEDAAQSATNCEFSHGELRAFKALGTHYTVNAAAQPCRSLFTTDGINFYAWNLPTRAYRHPTIDDTANRLIFHKMGSGLKVALVSGMTAMNLNPSEPAASWDVGVARPAAPSVSLGAATSGVAETVALVATVVNAWLEESAPSDPVLFDRQAGQSATYAVSYAKPAGQQDVLGINFYRTYPSQQGTTEYFLINANPIALSGGSASLVDASDTAQATITLQSTQWDTPPTSPSNLTYMGNGFFVVGAGKDLVFSEPYRPHAWPYRMTLPHGVVGIVAIEGGALVTTTAETFLLSGAHPSQVTQQLLPVEQAGWSSMAMSRIEGAAVYASNDGLVSVYGGQPSLKESQALFTRKDWRDRYGAKRQNLRLAHHDGKLLGFVDPSYPAAVTGDTFLLRLDEAAGAYEKIDVGQPIYGAAVSATTDQLYVTTATGFAEFAGSSTALTYTWQSGDRLFPLPVNFACGVVDAVGTATLEVYADGALRGTASISGRTNFRLQSGAPAYRWAIKLVGTATVREVSLAQSFAELKGV